MITFRVALAALVGAALAVGCGSSVPPAASAPPTASDPNAPSIPAPSGTVRPVATPTAAPLPTPSPTQVQSPSPADTVPTLGSGDQPLDAGTYRIVGHPELPPILINVPDGWQNLDGWAVRLRHPGEDVAVVAVQFWDVEQIYGHPCQWRGTLLDPGPTVDDLADALADVPLRNATQPVDAAMDGFDGKYLEWSVPADVDFADCDTDGGEPYFQSWTGDVWASGRYQQSPGQVDRLWIVDINGSRLVVDAFEMPSATAQERQMLAAVVESIRFER